MFGRRDYSAVENILLPIRGRGEVISQAATFSLLPSLDFLVKRYFKPSATYRSEVIRV
jgi:hypothetical protein